MVLTDKLKTSVNNAYMFKALLDQFIDETETQVSAPQQR